MSKQFLTNIKVAFLMGSLFFSCNKTKPTLSDKETSLFINELKQIYFISLDSCSNYLSLIDTSNSLEINKNHFLKVREWYKRAEPFIITFDYQNYKALNGPNLLKIEEEAPNDIKKNNPESLQVIEELLFAENTDNKGIAKTLTFLNARIPFIKKNNIIYRQSDRHFLQMIRHQIVTVATKGLTGFDSPMIVNSLKESAYSYKTILEVLLIYKDAFSKPDLYDKWVSEINSSIKILNSVSFEDFDRYSFIKTHINTQLNLINQTTQDWNITLNTSRLVDPKIENVFNPSFLNLGKFATLGRYNSNQARVDLGKKLFYDPSLSKDGKMSCASCHQADKAFTDGLKIARSNTDIPLQRNTPTITYVAYQHGFFYDAIALTLEGQIKRVIENTQEFHIDLLTLENKVNSNSHYVNEFKKLYGGEINDRNVRNAIATYERSLSPFNSKFDRNMQGKENTLSEQEIQGFNLFMGKAACATCHFPPAFNGTVPPRYDETELENLGVPANSDFDNPILDKDLGRYNLYQTEERKGFFKTSTVRNIALTAPYMHNGVYKTLEEVLHFYNVGGGQGMGLENPYQTLPADSLNLTEGEQQAIISFMKTLTDSSYTNNHNY